MPLKLSSFHSTDSPQFLYMAASSSHMYSRILLTGAAGGLGSVLRPRLKKRCDVLRVSDLDNLGEANAGEEVMPVALQDRAAVTQLLAGVDAVVHLAGVNRPTDEVAFSQLNA